MTKKVLIIFTFVLITLLSLSKVEYAAEIENTENLEGVESTSEIADTKDEEIIYNGRLAVKIYEKEILKELSGLQVQLIHSDGTLAGTYTTDNIGIIRDTHLKPDTYSIKILNLPDIYIDEGEYTGIVLGEDSSVYYYENIIVKPKKVKVEIATNLECAPVAIKNSEFTRHENTTNHFVLVENLRAGKFTITPGAVDGYVTPEKQEFTSYDHDSIHKIYIEYVPIEEDLDTEEIGNGSTNGDSTETGDNVETGDSDSDKSGNDETNNTDNMTNDTDNNADNLDNTGNLDDTGTINITNNEDKSTTNKDISINNGTIINIGSIINNISNSYNDIRDKISEKSMESNKNVVNEKNDTLSKDDEFFKGNIEKFEAQLEEKSDMLPNQNGNVNTEEKENAIQENSEIIEEAGTNIPAPKSKTLPRTGNDYFEVKVILFNSIIFIIYRLIKRKYSFNKKRQTQGLPNML